MPDQRQLQDPLGTRALPAAGLLEVGQAQRAGCGAARLGQQPGGRLVRRGHADGRRANLAVTLQQRHEALLDVLRAIKEVQIAALFIENAEGEIKVSLRSKVAQDVHIVARKLGGGGHPKAAGCVVHAEMAEAVNDLFNLKVRTDIAEIERENRGFCRV